MAERQVLVLSAEDRDELEQMRDCGPKAYMRERAAALLKIAAGSSPHAVAKNGLLKERDPDTVYSWLERYRTEGIAGLHIRSGRGRKSSFPPSVPDSSGSANEPAVCAAPVA